MKWDLFSRLKVSQRILLLLLLGIGMSVAQWGITSYATDKKQVYDQGKKRLMNFENQINKALGAEERFFNNHSEDAVQKVHQHIKAAKSEIQSMQNTIFREQDLQELESVLQLYRKNFDNVSNTIDKVDKKNSQLKQVNTELINIVEESSKSITSYIGKRMSQSENILSVIRELDENFQKLLLQVNLLLNSIQDKLFLKNDVESFQNIMQSRFEKLQNLKQTLNGATIISDRSQYEDYAFSGNIGDIKNTVPTVKEYCKNILKLWKEKMELQKMLKQARNDLIDQKDELSEFANTRSETVLARLNQFKAFSLLILGILFVGISYLIIRSIMKPLSRLVSYSSQVSQGDLDKRPEGTFGAEFGELSKAMQQMVGDLKVKMEEAEKKSKQAESEEARAKEAMQEAEEARQKAERAKEEGMQEAADQLQDIVSRISTSSEELSSQIEETSQGAEEQKTRSSEAASSIEQINSSILEIAKNANSAAESSENTESRAKEGVEVVDQTSQVMNQVHEQTGELEQNMKELQKQAEGIGEIMNVITDIADQTNLLALNAAIEAARAGESGKGFAVVADEVRKLAEKTMNATKDVEKYIDNIQKSTKTNVKSTSEVTQAIQKGDELANNSKEVLQNILSHAQEAANQVRQIATASEQQSTAAEQINRSTTDVNRIATETADSMRQSSEAVSALARLSQDLDTVIQDMKQSGQE